MGIPALLLFIQGLVPFLLWTTTSLSSSEVSASSRISSAPMYLPVIPAVVQKEAFTLEASSFINVWEHGLRLQDREKPGANKNVAVPKTIISPSSGSMMNLVPQDSGHPLYHDEAFYTLLRHKFLLDHMLQEALTKEDISKAAAEDGAFSRINMNGGSLQFRVNNKGVVSINGIPVSAQHRLSDGTELLVIEGLLFGHQTLITDAYDRMMKEEALKPRPSGCFMGSCDM